MKDACFESFSKTGEGWGKQIAYLGLAVDALNSASAKLVKINII